ncbi:hypothetical protein [Endozoicomonas sp. 8E]|uniref:hypothetical protein n=1 Tax=Endozoicomonas sp. 8E TaxID=3035692 RepID=UPI002938DE79|nr:hypothetical protein [Endozoicomonas sp. 8E]WOG30154.1 hypothetical protein P6910_11025 [Endozoicomonas sp. 8E]
MKTARLLAMIRLFLLFILSVILPLAGHSSAYTSLLSWPDWGSFSKDTEKRGEASGEINKLSFIGNNPPLLLTYDLKTLAESGKAVSELDNKQLYIILDSQPGDLFNFCFRTPPALSTGHFPSPPVIKKPVTGQGMADIQNGRMRRVASTPDSGFQQYEYSARWRLPAGNQSLVLAIEDNDNGWVIEPECSGIFSESAALKSSSGSNTSDSKKASFVDIFYLNKQTVKHGPDKPDGSSRFSGPSAIPGASDTADNSEPYISSGGGGFGGGNDLDDLFKKKPGNGMAPLYSFELTSEPVSRMILVPVPDAFGQTVKKQIWDTRIVLKIKRGWNEHAIIISQELWNKIRGVNLERSSGLFLALSRNPDNPEAAFYHYLSSHPAQSLQTEDYRRYARQEFILSPKQLHSVTVFPGSVPTGIGHSGGSGTSQAGNQKGDVNRTPPANTQFQSGDGRQDQGNRGRSGSGGDDGSDGSPDSGLCQNCNKPVLAFDKCKECLDRESSVLEQEPTEELLPAIRQYEGKPVSGASIVELESTEELLPAISQYEGKPVLGASAVELESTEELLPAISQNREVPVSGTKDADTSSIQVFQWFKTLESNESQREDCFRINDYYKFPELYRLLTQSFMSDKNTLRKFHSKWVKFLNGSLSLYHLISEVGELAKSQGIEDYVEVARIVKVLAVYRDDFENEIGLKQFRNELLNYLTRNDFFASDDPGKVFYPELGRQEKSELINNIYQIFEKTSRPLQSEIFPSRLITISMLNKFARDVYAKYGFGLPDLEMEYEDTPGILMWGCGSSGEYSFITPYNRDFISGIISQSLHMLALGVTANEYLDFGHVEAMLTSFVLIGSMHGQRSNDMFPEHASFTKDLPSEQLELLSAFSIKAHEALVKVLEQAGSEKKDKFIRSMFMIFGMVPKELSDELFDESSDPEPVPLTQAVAHAAAYPQSQESEISTLQPPTLQSDTAQTLDVCSGLDIDCYSFVKRSTPQPVTLYSTLALEELMNIGFKIGIDWQKFAKNTGVLNEKHIREIDKANVGFDAKARAMMEKWKRMKVGITFNDLLDVFALIGRYDLITDVVDRYNF